MKNRTTKKEAEYDYLIVGCGLYGATFAYYALRAGKKVLIVERRTRVGGNAYTERRCGITVHKYGAHIFHTSDKEIWEFVNGFAEFNHYVNSPVANYKGELYNLPFNMNTFNKLWGVTTPEEAERKIEEQSKAEGIEEPANLEEQALKTYGRDLYEKLIKGYTEKQWGRPCNELPAFIVGRVPFRMMFDNNYYTDKYQGVPIGGYTPMIKKMIKGATVLTGTDYFEYVKTHKNVAKKTVFTGAIDEFFGYCYGPLAYRTVRFETKVVRKPNFQGVAVMNFTDRETPYTRVIEHKHFEGGKQFRTVISYEYPEEWTEGKEPYYPVNNDKNTALYEKYKAKADGKKNVIFGGRLGTYRYYDMDKVIAAAFADLEKEGLKGGENGK